MTLTEWLRAQLDDDERIALAVPTGPWVWEDAEDEDLISHTARWWPPSYGQPIPAEGYPTTVLGSSGAHGAESWLEISPEVQAYIAAWDPARVLAEVKAKRAVLDEVERESRNADDRLRFGGHPGYAGAILWRCVSNLAQPYAGRDGWRDEWTLRPADEDDTDRPA